jgi:hypothetical protein
MPTRKITPWFGAGYEEDPTPASPGTPGPVRQLRDYVLSDPMGFLGSKREDRWRPGGIPTPPSRQAALSGMRLLTSHERHVHNAAQEDHARDVAARHRTGETTAAQGDNTPPSGSGGTPTPTPPPPAQSGAMPGDSLATLQTQDPYFSRMRAVRKPDGGIVFTNQLDDYGGEEAPVVDYEEAIRELGGSVSTPISADGTAYVHDRPGSGAVAPVALEARPPMSDRDATERGATLAARGGAGDARSILERRAWTERRLEEQRRRELEEAALAEAEAKAVDPRELAEIEAGGRWGAEQLEQVAEAERSARLESIVKQLGQLKARAIEAGDMESARYYDGQIRAYQRAYGRSVPEPRAPGFDFGGVIGDTVDEKLEEKKAAKK